MRFCPERARAPRGRGELAIRRRAEAPDDGDDGGIDRG
eukprot:COSAG02_NODE_57177_length_281_cov_1.549451_1_plen_37_part_10